MITLPFKDENGQPTPIENIIMSVIKKTTLPIYSRFVPWNRDGIADMQHLPLLDRQTWTYQLPAFLTTTPVMWVNDVRIPENHLRGTFGDINPTFGINRSVQGVIAGQAHMMLAGQMRAEPTFKYMGNNKIRLFGFPRTNLEFIIAAEHEPNGETLEAGMLVSFTELATLDVRQFLYNSLKYFNEIPTAHGTINLRIEDFQGAEAERKTWIDNATENFHIDQGFEKWM